MNLPSLLVIMARFFFLDWFRHHWRTTSKLTWSRFFLESWMNTCEFSSVARLQNFVDHPANVSLYPGCDVHVFFPVDTYHLKAEVHVDTDFGSPYFNAGKNSNIASFPAILAGHCDSYMYMQRWLSSISVSWTFLTRIRRGSHSSQPAWNVC